MAKLQSGTVVYGNLTVNTFANIAGNLILGSQIYAGGSYGTNGQVLSIVGATGLAWANPSAGSSIFNGTSNVTVQGSSANVIIAAVGVTVANVGPSGIALQGHLQFLNGGINASGSLGSSGQYLQSTGSTVQWATLSPNSIFNGTSNIAILGPGSSITTNVAGTVITTTSSTGLAVTGIVNSSGNILATGGVLNALTVNGAITGTGYFNTSANVSAAIGNFGNVTIAGGTHTGINAISPAGNAAVTLGSLTNQWSTIYGRATTAQYADLAEIYTSDKKYVPGTVVIFGGNKEVTISTQTHDTRIAGVISTNPAYLMNSTETGVQVALTGRVPCRVQGPVSKGDRLVASDLPGVATLLDKTLYEPGCIIGKALEAITEARIQTIEVVVGRI